MERKIWIVSDNHFNHRNIIKYCNRPFKCLKDMNDTMVRKWNRKVKKKDIVIHLGDFSYHGWESYFRRKLNGIIFIIIGNHDNTKTLDNAGFILIDNKLTLGNIIFTHRPMHKKDIKKGFINIHGHIHNKDSYNGINASVEKTNYAPIELNKLVNIKRI